MRHGAQCVFGDTTAQWRFVRGTDYFSILKRGINGVYHHVSHEHLPMYLAEFDFRYNARSGLGRCVHEDARDRIGTGERGIAVARLCNAPAERPSFVVCDARTIPLSEGVPSVSQRLG